MKLDLRIYGSKVSVYKVVSTELMMFLHSLVLSGRGRSHYCSTGR